MLPESRPSSTLLVRAWIVILLILCGSGAPQAQGIEEGIEDSLLAELAARKMLVIPECLSHDSYDAVQLPVRLISRWLENDHGIAKLVVGLESETDGRKYALIDSGRYADYERFATICPGGWGLFSTRDLNLGLFLKRAKAEAGGRLAVFGYENSYHYYDPGQDKYLLPTQVAANPQARRVPVTDSEAPMALKYAYSRFFRDWMSFETIRQRVEAEPDAAFLIITGNAHTLKRKQLSETDHQIADGYGIDTVQYAHWLGEYLTEAQQPLFVQSGLDSAVSHPTLFRWDPQAADSAGLGGFFADYYFALPDGPDANLEETPLVCVPSARNLALLADKQFQLYPDSTYHAIAQRLVYFLTGVRPEAVDDAPNMTGSATFLDPDSKQPLDFAALSAGILDGYRNGVYVARLREELSAYNHRSLFSGVFRMMGKTDFQTLSEAEGEEFNRYLLAALSVIGTPEERAFSAQELGGTPHDPYEHFRKYYSRQYP